MLKFLTHRSFTRLIALLGEILGWSMSLKHYCWVGSGVEVCLYLSIAGPAFPCRAPREKIEGDDGTGRGGSPTLRCYQAYTAPCPPAVGGKEGTRAKQNFTRASLKLSESKIHLLKAVFYRRASPRPSPSSRSASKCWSTSSTLRERRTPPTNILMWLRKKC